MLAYILAIFVAIGSFNFYMAAFFVPEMHRRQDFFWSGLGLFYAVVLWFCAGRLTGAVLLGQMASVALLGGLGWHTLALRRDLTPEIIQTPISWADLRQLSQRLQQQVAQYIQLDSAIAGVQSLWNRLGHQLSVLRNRTAGPRDDAANRNVPPLQRSPAYEFETAPGEGQSVPSEFATVSQLPRRGAAESQQGPERAAVETLGAASGDATVADAVTIHGDGQTAPQAAEVVGAADSDRSEAAEKTAANTSKKATSQSARPTPPSTKRSKNPITGIVAWLGDVASGFRKPKPQRQVVEIPPRSPSIPRPETAARSSSDSTRVQPTPKPSSRNRPSSSRAVIDIPPRPPSIPRSPTPEQTATASSASDVPRSQAGDANWVDIGEAESLVTPVSSPQSSPDFAAGESSPAGATQATQGTEADALRESSSVTPTARPAMEDTNWPDDEDTNWPD